MEYPASFSSEASVGWDGSSPADLSAIGSASPPLVRAGYRPVYRLKRVGEQVAEPE